MSRALAEAWVNKLEEFALLGRQAQSHRGVLPDVFTTSSRNRHIDTADAGRERQ